MLTGLYTMDLTRFDDVYGPAERTAIGEHARTPSPPVEGADLAADPGRLAGVEVLLTSWGCPRLTAPLLAAAPRLRLVLYAAGSVRPVVSEEFWARDIPICSGYAANATAVAEFAVAQVVYALKHGWRYVLASRQAARAAPRGQEMGANGSVVGVVSLGATGRAVCERLRGYDLTVRAHDPYAADPPVPTVGLEELFATSDVITVHAPLLPETRGFIDGALLASMRPDATLINTSRGAVIDEPALVRVLGERPDLFAVLDVTDPEPPVPGSPLFELPNAVVTPHLAGSLGPERRRLGAAMAEELARFDQGEPLRWPVDPDALARMA
jgi:phosphoglycerate dehydrogenase-like enzyme